MNKPLTITELWEIARKAKRNADIWVKLLATDTIVEARVGIVDGLFLIGAWGDIIETSLLWERDYGIKWLAYLEHPEKGEGGEHNG